MEWSGDAMVLGFAEDMGNSNNQIPKRMNDEQPEYQLSGSRRKDEMILVGE